MNINMDSIMAKVRAYAKSLGGDVSPDLLFPPSFMKTYTSVKSIREIFYKAGITDNDSYQERDDDKLHNLILEFTQFSSWDEMFQTAAKEFVPIKKSLMDDGIWEDETFTSQDPFNNIRIHIDVEVA